MKMMTGRRGGGAGPGFTLIELLLATVLLLLLLGASVFSFASLQRGKELDEGAAQFEALLRYARAEAANRGRQVQLSFEEEIEEGISLPLGEVRLLWEPDPLGKPGQFEEIKTAHAYLERINDLVEIDTVRVSDPAGIETQEMTADADEEDWDIFAERFYFLPPITFYPDGSSDSAEIILISRAEDDDRRVSVRLTGITGIVRREVVTEETEMAEAEIEESATEESSSGSEPSGMFESAADTEALDMK